MLGWGPATQIYLAAGATDLRPGFDGLYGPARDRLFCEPVCAKRLEQGRFRWPEAAAGQPKVVLSHEELALLLGGIDLARTRRRGWCRKTAPAQPKIA